MLINSHFFARDFLRKSFLSCGATLSRPSPKPSPCKFLSELYTQKSNSEVPHKDRVLGNKIAWRGVGGQAEKRAKGCAKEGGKTFVSLVSTVCKQGALQKIGACAMTTKCLDNNICTFKILLSWRFPTRKKKNSVLDDFPLCAQLPPPPSKKQIYFYCRLAASEKRQG